MMIWTLKSKIFNITQKRRKSEVELFLYRLIKVVVEDALVNGVDIKHYELNLL